MNVEKPVDSVTTVTLKEQGPRLPLGIVDAQTGNFTRDIAIRRWRMAEERALGELRDRKRDSNVSQFVGAVLSVMCTRLGPHNFETMKEAERELAISQMYIGDVFYTYLWLRVQTLGPQLGLNLTCPACRHKHPMTVDLETTEISCAGTPESATWTYDLMEPFNTRQRPIETLTLGPARWNALETMGGNSGLNTGAAKASIIAGSIVNVANWTTKEGVPETIMLADTELDEMGKRDVERLTREIDERALGPDMSIEGACPRCRYQYRMAMDWGYDSFFGDSSR